MADIPLADAPPLSDRVTPYDHAYRAAYIRMLDAAAEHADWREVASIVLGIDPDENPEWAKRVHDAHLARARWMTQVGYKDLLMNGFPTTCSRPRY